MMRLNLTTAEKLRKAASAANKTNVTAAASGVDWPTYDPTELKPGILHVG